MNAARLHLLVNHFPIIVTYFSTLLIVMGLIFKNETIKNTGLVFFIIAALFAIPALLSGDGAEDVLESIGQKNEHFIHSHEEIADNVFWFTQAIGLISLTALIVRIRQKKPMKALLIIILLTGLLNCIGMIFVGNTGGLIRHTEIRDAAQNSPDDSD